MPIEGFDYQAFAEDLTNQAMEILNQQTSAAPDSLTEDDKNWIADTIKRFCFMAGEALANDPQASLAAEQAALITQFIGEWTFHKSIDMISSGVPFENREPVLQIIAANIFNTAKLAVIKNLPQEQLITLVETKVKQVYDAELEKLVKKGVLTPEQGEAAANQSNLNDMVQKTEDEASLREAQMHSNTDVSAAPSAGGSKPVKFAALAVLLKRLGDKKAQIILDALDKNDAAHVLNYMKMSGIENKISPDIMLKSLNEIKKIIPLSDTINRQKQLNSLRKKIHRAPAEVIERLAEKERENIKDFLYDEAFPAEEIFTPYVLNAAAKALDEQLNDY